MPWIKMKHSTHTIYKVNTMSRNRPPGTNFIQYCSFSPWLLGSSAFIYFKFYLFLTFFCFIFAVTCLGFFYSSPRWLLDMHFAYILPLRSDAAFKYLVDSKLCATHVLLRIVMCVWLLKYLLK